MMKQAAAEYGVRRNLERQSRLLKELLDLTNAHNRGADEKATADDFSD